MAEIDSGDRAAQSESPDALMRGLAMLAESKGAEADQARILLKAWKLGQ